jgi:hypothetical protein
VFENSVLKCIGADNKRSLNMRMEKITKRKTYQFVLLTSYSQGIKKARGGGDGKEIYSTISGTTEDMYRQRENKVETDFK